VIITENPNVISIIKKYPKPIRQKLLFLRDTILETASKIKSTNELEETLKWGEPSYVTKQGSTIRIDWKHAKPNQYAMYFNCKSKLIDTFIEYYGDIFEYEDNRAIIFNMANNRNKIPIKALKHCIELSLTYHTIKHLPMLGL